MTWIFYFLSLYKKTASIFKNSKKNGKKNKNAVGMAKMSYKQ